MEDLYQASWYRSTVTLQGTQIVPKAPFQAYNPFEFYHPIQNRGRAKQSLYLEFLATDGEDPYAVLNFCERFGVLGSLDSDKPLITPQERLLLSFAESLGISDEKSRKDILAGTNGALDLLLPTLEHIGKLEAQNPEKAEEAVNLYDRMDRDTTKPASTEVCLPMEIRDFRSAQVELKRVLTTNHDHVHPTSQDPNNQTIGVINEQLFKAAVRPYLLWDIPRGQAGLGWESHTLTGILWLMMMLDCLGPGNVLTCPWCKTLFLASSPRRRFCSEKCGNNFKVREHKMRKVSEAQASIHK